MRHRKPVKKQTKNRGQMRPLTLDQVAMLEALLTQDGSGTAIRDLALLRVGIDSMLRSSDVVSLTLRDVRPNGEIAERVTITQQKTGKRVSFDFSEKTRSCVEKWLSTATTLTAEDRLFAITPRQHQRIVKGWCALLRLDPTLYSTHSIRRTKASHLYAKTKNIEVVKKLLGHSSTAATSLYLNVSADDALDLAKQFPI